MKIALVSPYDYAHPGGVNLHITALAERFAWAGHQVKIIASSSRPEDPLQNGHFIYVGKPFPIRASGSVVRVPISPRLFFSDRIKRILEQEQFDVVHIHEPLLPALSTSVIHHSSNSLNVGTFHAFRSNSWAYRLWKPLLQRWIDKLDGKIAVSQPARQFISKYFPADYTIIPNGIDLAHFSEQAAPIEQYRDDKLNILFVGRLEKRKGLEYLLGAYERVKRESSEVRLIVVSPPGRLLEECKLFVAESKLRDVVFTGYVAYQDLPRYYRTADIFCSPATGKESFGLVLLEAMATARPVIASNIEGYAGVMTHGVEGLLVKPADSDDLASAIKELLGDRALRERLGAQGRLKAGQFSWDRVASEVLGYYQKLLCGSGGSGGQS